MVGARGGRNQKSSANNEPIMHMEKLEELMNVKGIGEKSFLKLKPMITVAAKSDKPTSQR